MGEKWPRRFLSFPNGSLDSPNSSWDVWSWNLLKEKGFALLSWRNQRILGGFWVFPGFLSPNPSPIPAFGAQSQPPSEAAPGVRIDLWDLGTAQEKLLACLTPLPHPREAAAAHSSIRRKLGASFYP